MHVHGHGQCAACGTNVEPCCGGAGGEAGESPTLHPLDANPQLFERLFEGLGGPKATVAEDALAFALDTVGLPLRRFNRARLARRQPR